MSLTCALAMTWALPRSAQALACPRVPEQSQKDWDVEVKAAVGKLGSITSAELATRTRSVTSDLLGKLPQADRVYLEQMMYASYCSTLRDNTALSEAERETLIRAYNAELRSTPREPPVKGVPTAANDPQCAARKELARIRLAYTPEAFFDSVGKRKPAVALLFLKAGVDPDSADRQGRTALMAAAGNGDVAIVDALLRARSSASKRNPKHETALEWTALGGYAEIVRVLLARGADAESVNRSVNFSAQLGRTQAMGVLLDRVGDKCKAATEALRSAAASRFQRLIEYGANVDHRCSCSGYLSGGYTPLVMAAHQDRSVRNGQVVSARLLLQKGARADDSDDDGTTVLSYAESLSPGDLKTSLVAMLTKAGTK